MDGAANLNGVITIATANKTEVLDKALTKRPGRFDVILHYKNPLPKERLSLLQLNLSKTDTDKTLNINHIADITEDFSPAQIVEIVKRGYLSAIERGDNIIRQTDLVSAVDQLKEPATKEIGFKTPKGKAE